MDVYINRGIAKSDLGDKKGAIADYTEAIRVNPKIAFNYDFRGLAKHDLGDYQGAIADYNETVRLRLNAAAPYLHRGLSKKALGDKQGALVDLQKAAQLFQKQGQIDWYQSTLKSIAEIQKSLQ